MKKSTFRVRVTEAPRDILITFACRSRNLSAKQMLRIFRLTGVVA